MTSRGWGRGAAGVALALALLGCEGRTLPDLRLAPRFTLVDAQGRTRTSEELVGRVWIASFLFTTCPGSCPRIADRLHDSFDRFQAHAIILVTFSVDPERDTAPALAAFARAHGADVEGWWFLTGEPDSIRRIVGDGFGLALARAQPGAPGAHGPILHSTRVALVDRAGHVRGYYQADDDDSMHRLAQDAAALARGPR